ncbi:MAG: lipoyl(octanoyl) transferase LipB [candidate division WOR-3 bacterium]
MMKLNLKAPRIEYLGLVPYKEAWDLQKRLHQKVVNGGEERVLLLEHDHVITLGKSSKPQNLLFPREYLLSNGIEVYEVERGGDATYHGPGQLVGYFIVRVKSVKKLVDMVEEAIKRALLEVYPFEFSEGPHRGVWLKNGKKIASIGMAVKSGVSMHGFALNLTTDLRFFNLINPCGLNPSVMTSLEKETGIKIPPSEFYPIMERAIKEVF